MMQDFLLNWKILSFYSCVVFCRSHIQLQTTSVLSAYQNGLIEGHWRERCVNYEKQIKTLSANLRVADHEIRRLAGLDMSESIITSSN